VGGGEARRIPNRKLGEGRGALEEEVRVREEEAIDHGLGALRNKRINGHSWVDPRFTRLMHTHT